MWGAVDDVTAAFQALSNAPTVNAVDKVMPILERYVTIMYDCTSTCMKVNDARRDLFTRARKGRDIEAIPPTLDALRQHVKRPTYKAGHCWGNSLVPSPLFPCPSEWGWVKVANDIWAPLLMTIPQASQSCQELLKGGFKSERGCARGWRSIKAELPCTALRNCARLCDRE